MSGLLHLYFTTCIILEVYVKYRKRTPEESSKSRFDWACSWTAVESPKLWSLHITDETSKDKIKKQATYPRGDLTVFKQEYWDTPIRKKTEPLNNLKKILQTTKLLCWTTFRDRKYNIPDWMYRETFTAATRHKQRWWDRKIQKKEPLKKAQNNKFANVAGSVWLSTLQVRYKGHVTIVVLYWTQVSK